MSLLLALACYLPPLVGLGTDGVLPPPGRLELGASAGLGASWIAETVIVHGGPLGDLDLRFEPGPPAWTGPIAGVGARVTLGVHERLAIQLDTQALFLLEPFYVYVGPGHFVDLVGLQALFQGDDPRFTWVVGANAAARVASGDGLYYGGLGGGLVYGVTRPSGFRPFAGLTTHLELDADGLFVLVPTLGLGVSRRGERCFGRLEANLQSGFGPGTPLGSSRLLGLGPSGGLGLGCELGLSG